MPSCLGAIEKRQNPSDVLFTFFCFALIGSCWVRSNFKPAATFWRKQKFFTTLERRRSLQPLREWSSARIIRKANMRGRRRQQKAQVYWKWWRWSDDVFFYFCLRLKWSSRSMSLFTHICLNENNKIIYLFTTFFIISMMTTFLRSIGNFYSREYFLIKQKLWNKQNIFLWIFNVIFIFCSSSLYTHLLGEERYRAIMITNV